MTAGPDGAPRCEQALRLQVLGPVRAWRGEEELDLGSAQPRAVPALAAALDEALQIARDVGSRLGQANSLGLLGIMRRLSRDHAGGWPR